MIVFSVIPASSQCAFRLWGLIIAFHQELEAMERFIPPWRNLNKILLEFVQRLWVELEEAFAAGATAMHDFGPLEDEQNAPVQSFTRWRRGTSCISYRNHRSIPRFVRVWGRSAAVWV